MSVPLLASIKLAIRAALSSTFLLCTAQFATAAGNSAPASPTATQSADPQSQPIPLNSGLAPQEFQADASKVTMERLADGTRIYHMNGQGMQSLVAHLDADGSVKYTCTDKIEQKALGVAKKADEH